MLMACQFFLQEGRKRPIVPFQGTPPGHFLSTGFVLSLPCRQHFGLAGAGSADPGLLPGLCREMDFYPQRAIDQGRLALLGNEAAGRIDSSARSDRSGLKIGIAFRCEPAGFLKMRVDDFAEFRHFLRHLTGEILSFTKVVTEVKEFDETFVAFRFARVALNQFPVAVAHGNATAVIREIADRCEIHTATDTSTLYRCQYGKTALL